MDRVAADFDVEPVASAGGTTLLAALRKGGTGLLKVRGGSYQRHVLGVWHFVAVSARDGGFETRQWHIPRYLMAREMALRRTAFAQFGTLSHSPIRGDFFGLRTLMGGPDQLTVLGPHGARLELPRAFVRSLQADVPVLEKAAARVKESEGVPYVSKLTTPAGHPVASESRQLVEAMAFEKVAHPRLHAGNFGIYSAYCTFRDFDTSIEMPEEMIREMIVFQCESDPQGIPDEDHRIFLEAQERLLPEPLWGRGIQVSLDRAVPLLAAGFRRLSRTQRVQFLLMNGMHAAGLFLPLATVLGLVEFSVYADRMCQDWPEDNLQTQDRRHESAYIRLYGDLAGS